MDPRSSPISITNCTYCTLEQTTLLDSRLLHSDVIDIVYNLRISPVLCGPYTQGLQRPRFVNFGSPERFDNVNHGFVPTRSSDRRVSTLVVCKSQKLVSSVSSTSIRP